MVERGHGLQFAILEGKSISASSLITIFVALSF